LVVEGKGNLRSIYLFVLLGLEKSWYCKGKGGNFLVVKPGEGFHFVPKIPVFILAV